MPAIKDILTRDLGKRIEEVIKLDQADEAAVVSEIDEYVATDSIRDQYRFLLKHLADAPKQLVGDPGVWISGFFGSGKSSFAKNLGYAIGNRTVLGKSSSELFKQRINDPKVTELVSYVNTAIPTEVVMFDVSVDRAVRSGKERMTEIMYSVLLRELGYAEDFDIAELEIELEKEGRLDELMVRCQAKYSTEWRQIRKGAQKLNRASALLHEIDSSTYPSPDTWAKSAKSTDFTVASFVERTYDLCERRRPGKALIFIIDEVGQYVARSVEKIEDLRALVETFGKVGKARVKAKAAIAPVWIVVTAQEKLEEVVAAIDDKRIDSAKLRDRFRHLDLAPTDISQVASRRVLAKTPAGETALKALWAKHEGQLKTAHRLERTTRKTDLDESIFVQFYPYLPHFIDLSIDIVSGIRLQAGAPRHIGGSNRTIIKQAYEMLVSERTKLADRQVGALVTIDKVYELVEGNLSSERQRDIHDIATRIGEEDPWTLRVAKAISLLEFVRDIPRTEINLAALLIDEVGQPSPVAQVKKAIETLQRAKFISNTEEGWKLQTAQEKSWETERRTFAPSQRDRNQILRDSLTGLLGDPKLKSYRYLALRTFTVGSTWAGSPLGDGGQITIALDLADDEADLTARLTKAREDSRQEAHKNDQFWVASRTQEIDDLVASLFASQQMVAKFSRLRSQQKITNAESACLESEQIEVHRLQGRLGEKLRAILEGGHGVFRGVAKDGTALGKNLTEQWKTWLDQNVPDLFRSLPMGAKPHKGTEAEEILKAANLSGLAQLFYAGDQGLNLVIKQGATWVVNAEADIAKEVLDYLKRELEYGEKDSRTGKGVEARFGGFGYGWERGILQVVLAALLRAGAIEVMAGGARFTSCADPQSRQPFTSNTAFRSALFTPTKPLDRKTLTQSVEAYEKLSGGTVDVEKGAIATATHTWAAVESRDLHPILATARANGLSATTEELTSYLSSLGTLAAGSPDEVVKQLSGESHSLQIGHEHFRALKPLMTDETLALLQRARHDNNSLMPLLRQHELHGPVEAPAQVIAETLGSEDLVLAKKQLSAACAAIENAYRDAYAEIHAARLTAFSTALAELRQRTEWDQVPTHQHASLLAGLTARACAHATIPQGAVVCPDCKASIGQIQSDQMALSALVQQVIAKLAELTKKPEQQVKRVRASSLFTATLDSPEAVDTAVNRLRDHLHGLVSAGNAVVVE